MSTSCHVAIGLKCLHYVTTSPWLNVLSYLHINQLEELRYLYYPRGTEMPPPPNIIELPLLGVEMSPPKLPVYGNHTRVRGIQTLCFYQGKYASIIPAEFKSVKLPPLYMLASRCLHLTHIGKELPNTVAIIASNWGYIPSRYFNHDKEAFTRQPKMPLRVSSYLLYQPANVESVKRPPPGSVKRPPPGSVKRPPPGSVKRPPYNKYRVRVTLRFSEYGMPSLNDRSRDGKRVQFRGFRTASASIGAGMGIILAGSGRVWIYKVVPVVGGGRVMGLRHYPPRIRPPHIRPPS
ncbi:hypothetical protein F3Y22_tig00110597pilonHSYRG00153 [Hibiscus syriacus]|uniref:Uncharacterized protein n=1 Tax=Hibiscus syriacus TaxID=106335 RepID=A0A6A3A2C8_HIBSY|nr:hypothetical protein F3Y22_tig00110597pilonHSYRG00153 [Hibiscus syriacus]